jgi:hypothetical protein
MKWLLRRVLLSCLTLILICSGVVVLVRLNSAPSKLQQIGFAVCDGEPCFRGIKLGAKLEQVRQLFPDAVEETDRVEIPLGDAHIIIKVDDSGVYRVQASKSFNADHAPLVRAGEFIALYGSPCSVVFVDEDARFPLLGLVYPELLVVLGELSSPDNPVDFRLRPDQDTASFQIDTNFGWKCSDTSDPRQSAWHGFTSVEIYRARFARAVDLPNPPP